MPKKSESLKQKNFKKFLFFYHAGLLIIHEFCQCCKTYITFFFKIAIKDRVIEEKRLINGKEKIIDQLEKSHCALEQG